MLSKEVFNPGDLKKDARDNDHIGKCRYLIITSESLKESFEPLANWKVQKGITTEIVTVEDIYENYFGESPQVKVKSCILDYYQNKGTVFVLLGGDIEIVPVQRCYASTSSNDTDNTIPTDLFYACFDGIFNWDLNNNKVYGEIEDNIDLAPEVLVTRAPVQTRFHTETFVNKTLKYEKNPPLSGFANEMVNFGIHIHQTYDGRCDGAWLSDRMFDVYVDPYWSGIHRSFYSEDSTGISYDINDSLITSELNKGYNFTFMASHGQPNCWGTALRPIIYTEDIYNLNNANQQGIVVTGACYSNAFDNIIHPGILFPHLIRYDSCFSESFLRNPFGGGVAYHGSSRSGLGLAEPIADLGPSLLYSGNFFKSIFDFHPNTMEHTLGHASTQAKIHLIGPSMQEGDYRWLQFTVNTLGDPSLTIFTDDPEIISLTCADSISLGSDEQIAIQTGTSDIKICISNGKDVYHTGKTNNSGMYYCSPTPVSMDPLIVTATGHNKVYEVDTIKVGVPEGAVIIIDDYYVNGKNDNSTQYCENISIGMIFKNIGADTSFSTKAEFLCHDEYISINNNTLQLGDIPPGNSITIDTALYYNISCYVPDKHSYYPEVKVTNTSLSWNSVLELIAYAPDIHVENIFTETGSFHHVKPGDSTRLLIGIRNYGGADASNIKSYITGCASSILIYDYTDTNTTILKAGEVSTLEYGFFNNEPAGNEIFFIHEMIGDYFSHLNSFSLQVIDSLENFETGEFTHYPWELSEGNSEWIIDSINPTYNGRFSARSGIITPGQSSELKLKLNLLADGAISFYMKTSENNVSYGILSFLIDSIVQQQWPGSIDWAKEVFPVTAGEHTFTWKYHKTFPTVNDTLDGAWIDYITFPDFTYIPDGVSETKLSDHRVSVFPNPNNGTFNIIFSQKLADNTTIDILNMNGQVIYRQEITGSTRNSILNINPGILSHGIYIVKVIKDNNIITKKVVVH